MSDPRLLSEEWFSNRRREIVYGHDELQWNQALAHIDALKERCELLAVTLVDHTEWTTWVPSADGTGEWARRKCSLCGGEMAAEGDRLPHAEDCLLADLEARDE